MEYARNPAHAVSIGLGSGYTDNDLRMLAYRFNTPIPKNITDFGELAYLHENERARLLGAGSLEDVMRAHNAGMNVWWILDGASSKPENVIYLVRSGAVTVKDLQEYAIAKDSVLVFDVVYKNAGWDVTGLYEFLVANDRPRLAEHVLSLMMSGLRL